MNKKKTNQTKEIGERYYSGELKFPFQFEDFNCREPTEMPRRFFPNVKKLDYRSAIKADVSKLRVSAWQDMPRCWYIDAWFDCGKCGKEYCWTAKVQQVWFERFHIMSEAFPKLCPECRRKKRKLTLALAKFSEASKNALLRSTDLETKKQALAILEEIEKLSETDLTRGLQEKREILTRQIERMTSFEN